MYTTPYLYLKNIYILSIKTGPKRKPNKPPNLLVT